MDTQKTLIYVLKYVSKLVKEIKGAGKVLDGEELIIDRPFSVPRRKTTINESCPTQATVPRRVLKDVVGHHSPSLQWNNHVMDPSVVLRRIVRDVLNHPFPVLLQGKHHKDTSSLPYQCSKRRP